MAAVTARGKGNKMNRLKEVHHHRDSECVVDVCVNVSYCVFESPGVPMLTLVCVANACVCCLFLFTFSGIHGYSNSLLGR